MADNGMSNGEELQSLGLTGCAYIRKTRRQDSKKDVNMREQKISRIPIKNTKLRKQRKFRKKTFSQNECLSDKADEKRKNNKFATKNRPLTCKNMYYYPIVE